MIQRSFLYSAIVASAFIGRGVLADPVIDDFERASLGGSWRIIFGGNSPGIVNNSDLGLKNSSTRFGLVSWRASNLPSLSQNQYSEAVISSAKNSGMLTQVFVRWRVSDGARYGFHYAGDPTQAVFGKWEIKDDGRFSGQTRSLATVDATNPPVAGDPFSPPVPGDTLRVEVSGFTIKGFHNGVEVISVTDVSTVNRISGGEPGLANRWATAGTPTAYPAPVWESWVAGSLVVPAPGVADITVLDSSANANDLAVSFGDVAEMTTVEQSVFIRNDGDVDLMIGQIAFDDTLVAPFSIQADGCTATTLPVNGSCSFSIRFSPPSKQLFNDTFNIPSNDPDEGALTFSVAGTGADTTPTPTPTPTPSEGGGSGGGGSTVWSLMLLAAGLVRRYLTRPA